MTLIQYYDIVKSLKIDDTIADGVVRFFNFKQNDLWNGGWHYEKLNSVFVESGVVGFCNIDTYHELVGYWFKNVI